MKHKFILFFGLLLIMLGNDQKSFCQQWLWANQIGSDLHDGASGTTDGKGNFYIAGSFDGYSCQFLSHTLNKHGNNGMFIAKYDNGGNELWVNQFDVDFFPSGFYDGIGDIVVDNTGKMIQNIPVIMDQEKISLNISAEAKGPYNVILRNGKKSYSG